MTTHTSRHSGPTMALHWLMAALVLAAFLTGLEGPDEVIFGAAGLFQRQWHETLGVLVLGLMVFRLLNRLFGARAEAIDMPRWMHVASKALQGLLYLLMIGVPLLGLLGSGAEGQAVDLLGGVRFMPPAVLSGDVLEVHKLMGDAIFWLAGVHAAAALFHHYILRDRTLVSMVPPALADKLPGASALR